MTTTTSAIDPATIAAFARQGYTHLEAFLPPSEVATWLPPIRACVERHNREERPLTERDTYGQAFLQTINLWPHDEAVREIVFDQRLARAAAELLGVDAVRLYHDQALFKEAGGGHTPWHVDQYYWPLASDRTVTAWIPLVDVDLAMGPLAFAPGSQRLDACRDMKISDESHRAVATMLGEAGIRTAVRPYALGDVSFHLGWTYHCAGPNRTKRERSVMTVIYMDAMMTLCPSAHGSRAQEAASFCPGIGPGEVVASELNPVLWP